jgi:hypothetical protein
MVMFNSADQHGRADGEMTLADSDTPTHNLGNVLHGIRLALIRASPHVARFAGG